MRVFGGPTKGKRCRGLKNSFLSIDMMGEPIGFNIQGKGTHRTFIGSLMAMSVFVITIYYASVKFDDMINLGDTQFMAFDDREEEDLFTSVKDLELNKYAFMLRYNAIKGEIMDYSELNSILTLRSNIHELAGDQKGSDEVSIRDCSEEEVK